MAVTRSTRRRAPEPNARIRARARFPEHRVHRTVAGRDCGRRPRWRWSIARRQSPSRRLDPKPVNLNALDRREQLLARSRFRTQCSRAPVSGQPDLGIAGRAQDPECRRAGDGLRAVRTRAVCCLLLNWRESRAAPSYGRPTNFAMPSFSGRVCCFAAFFAFHFFWRLSASQASRRFFPPFFCSPAPG